MTDEELDRARAIEAYRLNGIAVTDVAGTTLTAARLAREGWTPPDPLEVEANALMTQFRKEGWSYYPNTVRKALQRGIEIGREQRP